MPPFPIPNAGSAGQLGATIVPEGVNFAVYSETASLIEVSLFDDQDHEVARIALDGHESNIHCGLIGGIGAGARYGLRADGPYAPRQGGYFDPMKLLIDPYAKHLDRAFTGDPRLTLGREAAFDTAPLMPKGIVTGPLEERYEPRRHRHRLIYEINVRGFSKLHNQVPKKLRGTVAALGQPAIIEHLHNIGADTVELMPVAAWIDDRHLWNLGLANAWGYNPVSYFAPDPRLMPGGIADLRALTDSYRRHGIKVILDVVYNHTGEGDLAGPVLGLKGLDGRTYYRHAAVGEGMALVNDTGCGNTLATGHPAVRRLILDSLKHWVEAGGVAGFRFDLAPVLGRTGAGFDTKAQTLEAIRRDPVLARCTLIAEPWDPGPGGYQLGAFGMRFREWNDQYRDDVRRFWRGDADQIGRFAGALSGSSAIFGHGGRKPSASVNFLAAHDGFTLADLLSYTRKHNEANGEANHDGHGHNYSWNCGTEGETGDAGVLAARRRDVRALLMTLFTSRGTPMLCAGDELGRTQKGNNNAYAQDNALTWIDWAAADRDLIGFVAALARFRKAHRALTANRFLTGMGKEGVRDVIWRGAEGGEMDKGDWRDPGGSVLGMHLNIGGDQVLVWYNRRGGGVAAGLPGEPDGGWTMALCSDPGPMPAIAAGRVLLPGRSVTALTAAGG